MAAATTVIAGAAALAAVGMGTGQMISGREKAKDAKSAVGQAVTDLRSMIEEGQANRLKALQIPTMGAELQERSLARATAGGIEAAQEAGAAGVIGGVGRITQAAGEQAAQQASELDRMQKERDRLVLQEEQRLEGQKYQGLLGLQQMELTGSQQALSDAQALQQAGAQSIASGLGSMASLGASQANPYGSQFEQLSQYGDPSRGILSKSAWEKTNPTGNYRQYLKTF